MAALGAFVAVGVKLDDAKNAFLGGDMFVLRGWRQQPWLPELFRIILTFIWSQHQSSIGPRGKV